MHQKIKTHHYSKLYILNIAIISLFGITTNLMQLIIVQNFNAAY